MKNPLFKNPKDPLSPGEEAEITKELADAYRQNEISEKQAAFKRIAANVKQKFSTRGTNK